MDSFVYQHISILFTAMKWSKKRKKNTQSIVLLQAMDVSLSQHSISVYHLMKWNE